MPCLSAQPKNRPIINTRTNRKAVIFESDFNLANVQENF